MLICYSKANFDVKNLFGKIAHQLDPEIRKMLVCSLNGIDYSMFDDLLSNEI